MKRFLFTLPLLLSMAVPASAAVKSEVIEYKQGDATLQGWLVYDKAAKRKRPGVVLLHDWFGATAHQEGQARKLAAQGYVVLVADVYGKGVRPADAAAAGTEAGKYYKDRSLLRERVRAGFDYLAAQPQVDTDRMAVMGYCFGGAGALELARSGAPLKAVVTFHGSLASANPEDAKNIKAKVLVQIGADDPIIPGDQRAAFETEMTDGKVDWRMLLYGGAGHSFTNPDVGALGRAGFAYDETTDKRSWRAMLDLFG